MFIFVRLFHVNIFESLSKKILKRKLLKAMKETKFRKTKTKTGMEEAAIYWRKANLVSLVLSLEVPRHVMGTHSSDVRGRILLGTRRCRLVLTRLPRSKLVNALALPACTRIRSCRPRGGERKKWLVASNCRSDDAVTNDRETTSCQ